MVKYIRSCAHSCGIVLVVCVCVHAFVCIVGPLIQYNMSVLSGQGQSAVDVNCLSCFVCSVIYYHFCDIEYDTKFFIHCAHSHIFIHTPSEGEKLEVDKEVSDRGHEN